MMTLRKDYTTHMPTLIRAVQITSGPVLELGSGVFSTPLLHWLCAESGRRLETYEDQEEFFRFANGFRSRNHRVFLVDDWAKVNLGRHWDVAFIDHVTERRATDALRLADKADFIVLHDSETDHYSYSEVYPHFKYIYHWKFCRPWTTVVSNSRDLSSWD
jgi:hypothetical protein